MEKQFFEDVFGDNQDNKLIWTLSNKQSHWFTDINEIAEFVEKNKNDIFYGLGTTKKVKTKYERATIDDISGILMLNLDIDIKHPMAHKKNNLPETMDQAIEIANKFLTPTYLIDSGHGLHALYKLTDEYKMDDKAFIISLFHYFQKVHRDAFPQYDLDYTHDLARVLRCPGSLNMKDPKNPVECKIISYDPDSNYWLSQIQDAIEYDPDYKPETPASASTSSTSTSTGQKPKYTQQVGNIDTKSWSTKQFNAWFDDQGLVIDKTAKIDGDMWMELASADPNFIPTYNHTTKKKRTPDDLLDTSDPLTDGDISGHDMSLANICAKYNLPDQKIVDLMIMHRNKYGINLDKLNRKDYFARTLINASIHKQINTIIKKKSKNQPISKNESETIRIYLSELLKCSINRLIRYPKDPNPQFELELTDLPGKTIKLGNFSEGILNQRNFRSKIGAVGLNLPILLKQHEWETNVIPKLQSLTINGIAPTTATYQGQIEDWTTEFFSTYDMLDDLPAYILDGRLGQPFMHNNQIHFKMELLQNFIRTFKNHMIDFNFFTSIIAYGFSQVKLPCKNGIQIQFWAAPPNFFIPDVKQKP